MTASCAWCRHSIGTPSGRLWCELRRQYPSRACRMFEREPGADDEVVA